MMAPKFCCSYGTNILKAMSDAIAKTDTVSNFWYKHHLTCSNMDSDYVHTLISGKQFSTEVNFPVRRLIASNVFRLSNQSGKADIISMRQEFQTRRLY